MTAAEAVAKCECRGGTFITDTEILDVLGNPNISLNWSVRQTGEVFFRQPEPLLASSLRAGVRWLIENKKI